MPERLAAFALVLRALVHDALGRLPEEPHLHVKRALAEHADEDARAALLLVSALGRAPGAPGDALRALLEQPDRAALQRALAQAARAAGGDERELSVLLPLAHDQERHADELPDRRGGRIVLPDGDVVADGRWEPPVRRLPDRAARDPFVLPGEAEDPINDELLAAEVAARAAHEHPAAPWELHADLARIAADRVRRAAALDAERTRDGDPWGLRAVDVSPFRTLSGRPLPERLAYAIVPGDPEHARIAERWATAD
jgi:hypothetical protein